MGLSHWIFKGRAPSYDRETNIKRFMMSEQRDFLPLNIAVLTVSDTRSEANDTSGRTLMECLQTTGHRLAEKCIVPDNIYRIRAVVSRWIVDEAIHAVLTTGAAGQGDHRVWRIVPDVVLGRD
jgi:hypothetical protein